MIRQGGNPCTVLMPTDEQRILPGDRLFVLSSINGLRRIERGERTPPRRWQLSAEAPSNHAQPLADVVRLLVQVADCSPERANRFVQDLPSDMAIDLYDYQAAHLIQHMRERLPIRLSPVV